MDLNFKAAFGEYDREVRLTPVSGSSGASFYIYLDDYYVGNVINSERGRFVSWNKPSEKSPIKDELAYINQDDSAAILERLIGIQSIT